MKHLDAIPGELRERAQWVVFHIEKDDSGKLLKVPRDANTGWPASSTDSTTWASFGTAVKALHNGGYDAVGYGFSDNDPFCGADFDHCRNPETGEIEEWAQTAIDTFASYAEVSVSGRGVHSFVKARMPNGQGRKHGNVEAYSSKRFFIITGQHIAGTPATIEPRQAELDTFVQSRFPAQLSEEERAEHRQRVPVNLPDEDLLSKARKAKNGAKFIALENGDDSAYGNDTSRGDWHYCHMLAFWTGRDAERIDRLFRQSPRYRDKWDEKRGAHTYGELTIADAIENCSEVYSASGSRTPKSPDQPSRAPGAGATHDETEESTDVPYHATASGLVYRKPTRDGTIDIPLTNFSATITADISQDDGAEVRREFEIQATMRGRMARFHVPAGSFAGMGWVTEHLGATAILYPGLSTKEHARTAIQLLSGEVSERHIYAHTGWRELTPGRWVYLHCGGAIGADGVQEGVAVTLTSELRHYVLPVPPTPEVLPSAIHASIRILDVAPDRITIPLFCAVYRAALAAADFALFICGKSGEGKTELAALAQQHFGAGMIARNVPASWSSSANALEALAFTAKDALLVIDDFIPTGSNVDVQRLHRDADRVLRAQGNNSGRQRMRPDGTLRPAKPPRGLMLVTGEDVPRGTSLRSRMLILDHMPGTLRWDELTRCQADAATGLYAQVMAAYLQWLAPQYAKIHAGMRDAVADLRQQALQSDQHKRTPEIIAHLALGMRLFLRFAAANDALSKEEADAIWKRTWRALGQLATSQTHHQDASDPAKRFVELIRAALGSGKAHLAAMNGQKPGDATVAYGWRQDTDGSADWQPQGTRIGWVDGESIYLNPDAAFSTAQQLGGAAGDGLAVTIGTLKRRLKEQHLLASWDETRQTITIRRVCEGAQHDVLHFARATLYPSTPPDKPDKLSHNSDESGAASAKTDATVRLSLSENSLASAVSDIDLTSTHPHESSVSNGDVRFVRFDNTIETNAPVTEASAGDRARNHVGSMSDREIRVSITRHEKPDISDQPDIGKACPKCGSAESVYRDPFGNMRCRACLRVVADAGEVTVEAEATA